MAGWLPAPHPKLPCASCCGLASAPSSKVPVGVPGALGWDLGPPHRKSRSTPTSSPLATEAPSDC